MVFFRKGRFGLCTYFFLVESPLGWRYMSGDGGALFPPKGIIYAPLQADLLPVTPPERTRPPLR